MHFGTWHRRSAAALSIALSLMMVSLWAAPVQPTDARLAVGAFLGRRAVRARQRGAEIGVANFAGPQDVMAMRQLRDDDGSALAYIAELSPRGFVVTSADTRIAPIVAYSLRHGFPGDEREHPFWRMVKEDLRRRSRLLAEHPSPLTAENEQKWRALGTADMASPADGPFQQWPPEGTTSTGGWLETVWDQHPPYNQLCPLDPVDANRTYVGCVATACAQIVNYHEQCNALFGPDDEYTSEYGIDFDADSGRYSFPSFTELNDYLATIQSKYDAGLDLDDHDIAALGLACGIAVKMNYSSEGSGAYSSEVRDALLDKLGFHSADLTGGMSCEMYPILQENLANGLPAYLSIIEPNGASGHAIVCDGYNTDGEYHLNFGWGDDRPEAVTDVWYRLPMDVPTELNVLTESVLNIRPDQPRIDVEPASLLLYCLPGEESDARTLRIRSNRPDMVIDSIVAPSGFLVAGADGSFSDRVDGLRMNRVGEEVEIQVKFYSETAGSRHGVLVIAYDDGGSRNVILDGCAFAGGTEIGAGTVSGLWSHAGSPYFVAGDVTIAEDQALIVEPGVQVMFLGPYGMTVGPGARLLAMGNEGAPIEFTAWNRQMGWAGLRFIGSGNDDILGHCSITFARKGAGIVPAGSDDDPDEMMFPEAGDPNHFGGALYCDRSDPTIVNCEIANSAGDGAGALYCFESRPNISNTVIANNLGSGTGRQCGGILADEDSLVDMEHCTIVNNAPGGIFCMSWEGMNVTNSIVWGNAGFQIQTEQSTPTVSFCDVQDGYPGQGNIDADPRFLGPSGGAGLEYDGSAAIWKLTSRSPCINAGTEIDLAATDLAGNPRVHSHVVDLGAYENQSLLPLITVLPSATLDAGFVPLDSVSAVTLEILNTGSVDVRIEDVSIPEANVPFVLLTSVRNRTLAPGDSIQAEIEFAPTDEGPHEGTLRIQSSADNARSKVVALRGTGVTGTVVPGGVVSGVWARAQSPVTITGDVFVAQGGRLAIEPGVAVKFAGHFGLTVGYEATLSAVGTEEQNVTFTAVDTAAGWAGIRFINSAHDDELVHCRIEYGKKSAVEDSGLADILGGAVICTASDETAPGFFVPSSPTIEHCTIAHNSAVSGGGVVVMYNSEAVIRHCRIVDNDAQIHGGGLFIWGAFADVGNNIIAHNSGYFSGGLTNGYALSRITNNTIVHNRPNGLHLEATELAFWGTALVANNIVWENELVVDETVWFFEYDIRYNDIQGGWDGPGNIEADPLFADPENRDYHLRSAGGRWTPARGWVADPETSPCIDAGDPLAPVGAEPEPHGGQINMGAYGGTAQAGKSP